VVIVPSIDVRAGRVSWRGGDLEATPRDLARRFVDAGADELHLVDLDGAERGDYANVPLLAEIARGAGIPCRLAGGIATIDRARRALAEGFAGVLFSSAVFGDDDLLREIAALGGTAIVELESRDGFLAPRGGPTELVERATGRGVLASAAAAVRAGLRAMYVIDLAAERAPAGPPIALIQLIRSALGRQTVGLTFHTGGGVRDLDDVRALAACGVASVVVGRALAEGRFTLADAKAAAA